MNHQFVKILFVLYIFIFGFLFFIRETTEKPDQPKLAPGEWMAQQRMYPYDEIKQDVYQAEMKKAQLLHQSSTRLQEYEWEFVGPTNIGGRITDIEMPAGQSNTIYVGAATGGILKTEDAGISWQQLFYDIPTISIGDIAIDPQNSDVLYVGTGEANSSSFSFLGSGVYKSIDAGQSWSFSGLENTAYIGRMIVDHSNSDRVFAAASGLLFSPNEDRGIYRSTDAGASWEQVLFITDTTAAIDLVQHPTDPDILYAGFWERTRGLTTRRSFGLTTGIYRTTDGGDSWEELTNGLPNALQEKGRVGLSISVSNPDVLYALYDMPDMENWVYKTEDGGDNWFRVDNDYLYQMGSNFGWYFGQIRVHPEDEDIVFAMGQTIYRTSNSGAFWVEIDNSGVHVDHHAMCFDLNSGRTYLGNDGGLYWSSNLGGSWNKINNLPITQFYAYDVSETNQDFQVGGTQDNNSIRTIGGETTQWEAVLGGDGMYNRINQQNNDIAWAEYQYGNLYRSFNAQDNYPDYDYVSSSMQNDRKNWSAPLELVPGQNEIAYFGTHRVWKTTNNGISWSSVSDDLTQGGSNYFHSLTCLAISTLNADYVMAGSADGRVHISLDAADSWEDISSGLPERWITDVYFDPQEEQTIYATVSGFRWDEALPHIFKSDDLGQSWTSISGNLPELPVNQMEIDPDNNQKIIVGTDAGIYMTFNGGENWESITGNLPMVPVVAFKLIPQTKDLYAATYGLSTWKMNLNDIGVGIEEYADEINQFSLKWVNSPNSYIELENHLNQSFGIYIYNTLGQLLDQRETGPLTEGKHQFYISDLSKTASSSILILEFRGLNEIKSIKIGK
jgi:photosystem II stability/assembly factor-like uncharacterized protein